MGRPSKVGERGGEPGLELRGWGGVGGKNRARGSGGRDGFGGQGRKRAQRGGGGVRAWGGLGGVGPGKGYRTGMELSPEPGGEGRNRTRTAQIGGKQSKKQ